MDGPVRNRGKPDERLRWASADFDAEPSRSWWPGTRARVAEETFARVRDALDEHECDAVLGFGAGAAVALQTPRWVEGLRFAVLIGAVGERAVESYDRNCPAFSILDRAATWGPMSLRMAAHAAVSSVAAHAEGDAVPADPRPYKLLNQFMAEFVGGHERLVEELELA